MDYSDYVKTEKDGVITFTPKKKEVTGERSRVKRLENYYFIDFEGDIETYRDVEDPSDDNIFNYGNYYETREQAQAVADLRRHVYKFPPTSADNYYFDNLGNVLGIMPIRNELLRDRYNFGYLPITATKEDQEERSRLIKRCLELNGYVSI